MQTKPTVFSSASEITIAAEKYGPIRLTAPGYSFEITRSFSGSVGLVLRAMDEEETRPGFDHPLSYVVTGGLYDKVLAHFTCRAEAEKLIEGITSLYSRVHTEVSAGPDPKSWTSRLMTLGEFCGGALIVGLLCSVTANVGWHLASHVWDWNDGARYQSPIVESAPSMQDDAALAVFKESLRILEEKASKTNLQMYGSRDLQECRPIGGWNQVESDQEAANNIETEERSE